MKATSIDFAESVKQQQELESDIKSLQSQEVVAKSELESAMQKWQEAQNTNSVDKKPFNSVEAVTTTTAVTVSNGYTQEDIDEAREAERNALMPLIKAGAFVRGRRLEWHKSDRMQNQVIIKQGNGASHYGMALADALLYSEEYPAQFRLTDIGSFMEVCGVFPDFVLKHRACEELMNVLDWRGAMKDFHKHSYTGCFDSTNFNTKFCALRIPDRGDWTTFTWYMFMSGNAGAALYDAMKVDYETALAKHQTYISSRKHW